MAQRKVSVFANQYFDAFKELDLDIQNKVVGNLTLDELKKKFSSVIKNKYIDIVYLESSVFKSSMDLVDFVKYMRVISDDFRDSSKPLRIVVVAPNLIDETILHHLVTYHVYDIINPLTADASFDEVVDLLYSELSLNLANPSTFSKVEYLLKPIGGGSDIDSNTAAKGKIIDDQFLKGAGSVINKLFSKENNRTYIVYNEADSKDNFSRKLKQFSKRSKLQFVGDAPLSDDVQQSLANIRQLFVDVLILYRPSIEQFKEIYEIVTTVDGSIGIYVFLTDYDLQQKFSKYVASQGYGDVKIHFLETLNFKDMENAIVEIRTTQRKIRQSNILRNKSTVVSVVGSKGGVGTTSISALLAKQFGDVSQLKIAVVDFSFFVGDLNVMFGITEPEKNIFNWFSFVGEMYRNKVANINLQHDMLMEYCYRIDDDKNVWALVTPNTDFFEYTNYDFNEDERNFALNYTLQALKDVFDVVILDVSTKYSDFDIAMQNSTHTIIVSDSNISSAYRFKYGLLNSVLDTVYRIRHDNLFLLINKDTSSKDEVSRQVIKELLEASGGNIEKENVFRIKPDNSIPKSENLLDVKSSKHSTNKTIQNLANSILNVISKKKQKNSIQSLLFMILMSLISSAVILGAYYYLFLN